MELYKDILAKVLAQYCVEVAFKDLHINPTDIVEAVSYQTLKKIHAILHDPTLDDGDCFMMMEEILCAFEDVGAEPCFRNDL